MSIDLSPDGLQILGGGFGKALRVWDTTSHKLVRQFETGAPTVRAVAFHPQGLSLVASTANGLHVWELRHYRLFSFSASQRLDNPIFIDVQDVHLAFKNSFSARSVINVMRI